MGNTAAGSAGAAGSAATSGAGIGTGAGKRLAILAPRHHQLLASVCLAQQDVMRAALLLNDAVDAPPPSPSLPERIIWCARAELEAALTHPDKTLSIIETLITSGGVGPDGVIPRLWHLRAEAQMALSQTAEAEALLYAAVEAAEAQGIRPMLWRLGGGGKAGALSGPSQRGGRGGCPSAKDG